MFLMHYYLKITLNSSQTIIIFSLKSRLYTLSSFEKKSLCTFLQYAMLFQSYSWFHSCTEKIVPEKKFLNVL